MAAEKLTTDSKIKPGPIHKLRKKGGHEVRLIRPWMQHKNPGCMYLKFLTPLTPSVEKTVNPMGSNMFINQEISEVTVNGFKKCCTSNAVDETDGDMLWNGNEEEGVFRSE